MSLDLPSYQQGVHSRMDPCVLSDVTYTFAFCFPLDKIGKKFMVGDQKPSNADATVIYECDTHLPNITR